MLQRYGGVLTLKFVRSFVRDKLYQKRDKFRIIAFILYVSFYKGKYGSLRLKYISNPLLLREGKNVDVNIEADIKRDLPGALKADVRLEKEFGFVWIPIPCFNNMGSW